MRFGSVPLAAASGSILAHSQRTPDGKIAKGRVLGADDLAALAAAGIAEVVVAQVDPGDVAENDAAARLGAALTAPGLALSPAFTGRANLHAEGPGVLVVDRGRVDRLNRIHPAITLATLAPFARVAAGTLAGTIKIIAYAVPGAALAEAVATAGGAVGLAPVRARAAALLLTRVPGESARLASKGRDAVAKRLDALGIALAEVVETPHAEHDMAAALGGFEADLLLILTGSATSDLHDTGPEALRRAGGTVARFGMPVDPGNLLFYGTLGERPVIGLPGCARSPALNGADWVLDRLACGLPLGDDDIAAMGVGGLLKETRARKQPREAVTPAGPSSP